MIVAFMYWCRSHEAVLHGGPRELVEKLSGNCVFSACAGQAGAYKRSVIRI